MGTIVRLQDRTLSEHLIELQKLDSIQLLRVLSSVQTSSQPQAAKLKGIQFRSDLSLAFPIQNNSNFELDRNGHAIIQTVDFCLASVIGPLPEPFLEWIKELEQLGQTALRDFLDIFNNRLNHLRYQVRLGLQPGINNTHPSETLQAQRISALMGIQPDRASTQVPVPLISWLALGENLINVRRSASGLESVLTAYFDCPVHAELLVPQWVPVGKFNEHYLGSRRLGVDSILGRSIWDRQSCVRLVVGPISFEMLASVFSYDQKLDIKKIENIIRLINCQNQDVWINFKVHKVEIPFSILSNKARIGLRLGKASWLKYKPDQSHPNSLPAGRLGETRTVQMLVKAREQEMP